MSEILLSSRSLPVTLADVISTGESNILLVPPGFKRHTIYIKSNGSVTSGSIAIETVHDPTHASDKWATILSSTNVPTIDNKVKRESFEGAFIALKVRILSDIVGGTISLFYTGF